MTELLCDAYPYLVPPPGGIVVCGLGMALRLRHKAAVTSNFIRITHMGVSIIAALKKPAQMLLLGIVGTGGLIAIIVPVFSRPTSVDAETAPLYYTFNSAGTLYEADSPAQSTSPYFWLQSGAKLSIAGGSGSTVQGALPLNDPWRGIYANSYALSSDNGAHPQNLFRMFTKQSVRDASVQIYFNRTATNIANVVNRQPYNGESLIARYQDTNNYYYGGIRADGQVVIKKKTNGIYQTLAYKKVLSGTYNATSSPDLIPQNIWMGLKFTVVDDTNGVTRLALYTDMGRSGTWLKVLDVVDDTAKYGPAIRTAGTAGIQSDYADMQFDNFLLAQLEAPQPTASTPPPPISPTPTTTTPTPSTSAGYDSVVLADKPVLYLAMNSASTGKELDKSGRGLVGTYKGGTPTLATMPNGDKAASFNGSSQYLTVPSNAALSIPTTGKLTWEAWIRPDTFNFANDSSDGYVDWMGKCASYSPTCEWEARIYGSNTAEGRPNRLSAYVFNPSAGLGSAADWQPASGVLSAGKWVHVVAQYDTTTTPAGCNTAYPGSINIWVNGVKQSLKDHLPTGCMSQFRVVPKANNSPLNIGTMAFDTWFKGAVGKVAVYNRLLTQTEINEHFKSMTGVSPAGSCGDTCTISTLGLY